MTKREFIWHCLIGAGGLFLGFCSKPTDTANGKSVRAFSDDLWKWSKEAMFYSVTARGLLCKKCPNNCVLQEGQTGLCRNRVAYKGKMYSIAYGNPCAVHIDPIEKKPFFHFLPGIKSYSVAAAGCNFACLNCQNWQIAQVSPRETENYDLMPEAAVEQCLTYQCESIAYTYSEPITFYEYAYDTAKLARARNIKNVWKSNGYIHEEPLRLLCKQLDAANIDLKGYDDDTYLRLNGGRLQPVLQALKIFKEEKVWLEITNLVIPGWTDDLAQIKNMCRWLADNGLSDAPLHFTRFTPMHKLTQVPATPVSTLEKARETAMKEGLKYVYLGNVPGHASENTYCHQCGKMILQRRGFVIVRNAMNKGKCSFCGAVIPGVWS